MQNSSPIESPLCLPNSNFQPFFLKAMNDFILHHKLPVSIRRPSGNMNLPTVFSCILDAMAHSMGKEKREMLLKELEEYKHSLPTPT